MLQTWTRKQQGNQNNHYFYQMGKEIERKFLVAGEFKKFAIKKSRITQGYLSTVPVRTVRVRKNDNKGTITIKGAPNATGITRFEWEREIPAEEALELLTLCEPGIIDKTRFILPEKGGLKFEVDEFYGENEGLLLAEIELPSEDHSFTKPIWLGKEVTGDPRYYNSMLARKPFCSW